MKDNIKYNQPIIFQRREIVKHFKIEYYIFASLLIYCFAVYFTGIRSGRITLTMMINTKIASCD